MFEAMHLIAAAAEQEDETVAGAVLRYLAYHSMLSEARGDGIILGASRLDHVCRNMDAIARGPLSDALVSVFEQAWQIARQDSPAYLTLYQNKSDAVKEAK